MAFELCLPNLKATPYTPLTTLFTNPSKGFPRNYADGSDGKESVCNVGDLGLIPGLGRSPGEGNSYPLVVQMVKNPPTMQETWIRSLGWEDPLEEGMATHFNILAWRIPWTKEPGGLQSTGLQSRTGLSN